MYCASRNDLSGKTRDVNASGPRQTTDDLTVLGPQLFFTNVLAGVQVYYGKYKVVRDENGLIVDVPGTGTVSGNLCDLLA